MLCKEDEIWFKKLVITWISKNFIGLSVRVLIEDCYPDWLKTGQWKNQTCSKIWTSRFCLTKLWCCQILAALWKSSCSDFEAVSIILQPDNDVRIMSSYEMIRVDHSWAVKHSFRIYQHCFSHHIVISYEEAAKKPKLKISFHYFFYLQSRQAFDLLQFINKFVPEFL